MRKYVYLFELDSVRKSDAEIRTGQQTLYDEIVKNGNVVVLTYNQLVDSRAFFSLLDDKNYYESFIELIKKGYIRISQFGTTRTIAQYLLNSIETEDNNYIYSALPIKGSQRRLIELIKRSITFSDLSEINEYIHRLNKSDEELIDLFVEVECNNRKNLVEHQSQLTINEMDNVLENLYWLLGMVLRVSTIHDAFIPPRDPAEYACFRLRDYLSYISKVKIESENKELWNQAIHILTHLNCWGTNNRSLYFRELREKSTKLNPEISIEALRYAEAIVNICTNYAYEMSICNISKHYNADDLIKKESIDSSFFKDFMNRLELHWDSGIDAEIKFLQSESNKFEEFSDIETLQKFSEAVRVIPRIEETMDSDALYRYEYNLKLQRRKQKLSILKKVPGQVLSLFLVALMSVIFNLLIETVHNLCVGEYSPLVSWRSFFWFGIESILVFMIGEFVTVKISNKVPKFLSLSEAIQGMVCILKDASHVVFSKTNTYMSECDVFKREKRNKSIPIDFSESEELKKYVLFYKNHPELVARGTEYPIVNVLDRQKLKAIVRNQELYRQKYGIVYSSVFNTMVVDPIEDGENGCYSYERVVSASMKRGVVLFTVCDGKIILLKQFRHAIRREQLCCPRGFGELDVETKENAIKELYEELNAIPIAEPVELGSITADSGLSGGTATVYLMKIDHYANSSEEGIREIIEITPEELFKKICKGTIDDGYTLAAYLLYSAYTSSNENSI